MVGVSDPNGPQPSQAAPSAAPAPTAQPAGDDRAARLAQAKRRVDAMKGFYIHLTVFVLVLAGLFVVNALSSGDWWVQWVLLGWGIGVIAHGAAVFGRAPRAVADWEQRKVNELAKER